MFLDLSSAGSRKTILESFSARIEAFSGAAEWELSEDQLEELDEIIGTLPEEAASAKSIVWDHFPEDAVQAMADRRHRRDGGEEIESK